MMKLSLRWKLIFVSVLVEVVMLSVLVGNSLRFNEENLSQLTELRAREMSHLLSAEIAPLLLQKDYAAITELFRTQEHGIDYFLLFGQDHQLLLHSGWTDALPASSDGLRLPLDSHRRDIRVPLVAGGSNQGELVFGLSTRFAQEAQKKLFEESILISFFEVVVSTLFLYLLGLWLTRHLRQLEAAANAISAGEFDTKVKYTGKDEIGVVGHALNVMSDQLASEIAALRLSEQQQRETANRLLAVFEAVPDYMTLSQLETGRILYANAGFEKLTGHNKQDAIGKTSLELGIWSDPEQRKTWTSMILEQGIVSDFQGKMQTKDGQVRSGLLSAAIVEVDGARHIVAICKDITDRLEAEARVEAARRDLQAVLDAASEISIIATNKEGLVTIFNRGAEKMLGYRSYESVGQLHATDFHDADEMEQRSRELSEKFGREITGIDIFSSIAIQSGMETRNWIYVTKYGKKIHVSLSVTALVNADQEITGYLGIARDITPQIEAREALNQLNGELESRVRQRTAELESANHELASTMGHLQMAQTELLRSEKLRALGDVVAVVAHELNTPIGNCLTVASTLLEKSREISTAFGDGSLKRSLLASYLQDTEQGMGILLRGLNRSSELVMNFKQVAADQVSDQRRPFDLQAVVKEVTSLLQPMLRKTPFVLQVDIPEKLIMDSFPGALEQIITNLINNAVAHAFDGQSSGTMTIHAELTEPDKVKITFADDGIGIEPAHMSRVFDPFYTTKMGRGGTGLGLNIVHNIVIKMLGGKLEVESVVGRGTRFIIHLPLTAPYADTAPGEVSDASLLHDKQ
ncbi:PAS domain S-box protein [Undibacterium sp. WLX3042]|uniref:PAS domain S-box protein n=1 Tax=Undibacterium sp. WLX3042 TaxID=3412686 RepID=UPI003C2D87C0